MRQLSTAGGGGPTDSARGLLGSFGRCPGGRLRSLCGGERLGHHAREAGVELAKEKVHLDLGCGQKLIAARPITPTSPTPRLVQSFQLMANVVELTRDGGQVVVSEVLGTLGLLLTCTLGRSWRDGAGVLGATSVHTGEYQCEQRKT